MIYISRGHHAALGMIDLKAIKRRMTSTDTKDRQKQQNGQGQQRGADQREGPASTQR